MLQSYNIIDLMITFCRNYELYIYLAIQDLHSSSFNHFTLYLITNDKRISCSPILKEYSILFDDSTDVYPECIDEYITAVYGHFQAA